MVQNNAARCVLGKDGKRHQKAENAAGNVKKKFQIDSITEMLSGLGWRSLKQRRADTRLNMLHKITNEQVHITNPDLRPVTGMTLSVYPHRLVNFRNQTASQFNSYYPRTVHQWNHLDSDVALATFEAFTSQMSKVQH